MHRVLSVSEFSPHLKQWTEKKCREHAHVFFLCLLWVYACVCLWAAMASFNNRFNRCQTHDSHKRNEEEKDAERNKSGEGVRDKKDKETPEREQREALSEGGHEKRRRKKFRMWKDGLDHFPCPQTKTYVPFTFLGPILDSFFEGKFT